MEFTSEVESEQITPIDLHVLSISEVFVYKVPPLRSASGHRAEDWGLEHPLFTGCIKIYQNDEKLRILLFKYVDQTKLSMVEENIVLFGECPVVVKPGENVTNFVDAVIDSSRYYVLRLKDPRSERTILIGVGFRERDQAFDFKSALNEYVKYIDRMHLAQRIRAGSISSTEGDEDMRSRNSSSAEELSSSVGHLDEHIAPLKDGEKIKIAIKLNRNKATAQSNGNPVELPATSPAHMHGTPKQVLAHRAPPSNAITAAHETHSFLRPPSFHGESLDQPVTTAATVPAAQVLEEEWGDFVDGALPPATL